VGMDTFATALLPADAEPTRLVELERTVARLVADLARSRGVDEAVIRLEHGLPRPAAR